MTTNPKPQFSRHGHPVAQERGGLSQPGTREYAAIGLLGVANLAALQSIVANTPWFPLIGGACFAVAYLVVARSNSWTADEKQPAFLFVLYAFVAAGVLQLGDRIYEENPFPMGAVLGVLVLLICALLCLAAAIQIVTLFLRVRRNGAPRE